MVDSRWVIVADDGGDDGGGDGDDGGDDDGDGDHYHDEKSTTKIHICHSHERGGRARQREARKRR